jgi:DNA-binding transcriptional regulator YdaS (Cro superfamily)
MILCVYIPIDIMYTHSIIHFMTLAEYIKSFPRKDRTGIRIQLAKKLGGITEVYVRSMCNGYKKIPAKFAIRIEAFTGGLVTRQETAPDFYPIETK